MSNNRHRFSLVDLFWVTLLIAIPLALYYGYVNDQKFGLKPGVTVVLPQRGFHCFDNCSEDRYFIKGADHELSLDDLN